MIYIFEDLDKTSEKQCRKLLELLPPSRKEKALKFEGVDRKIAIVEYFKLKKLLGLKENLDFTYNENGKPSIDGYYFSISRCDGVLCIAVGDSQIGVDVEKTRKYDERFARFILNDGELAFVESRRNKDEALTKLWTQKEATLKCLGLALNAPLKNIVDEKRFSYTFKKHKEYYACQCVSVK